MVPEGGVEVPLPHDQAVQASAGQGQVEKGRVRQQFQDAAEHRMWKMFKASAGVHTPVTCLSLKHAEKLLKKCLRISRFNSNVLGWF